MRRDRRRARLFARQARGYGDGAAADVPVVERGEWVGLVDARGELRISVFRLMLLIRTGQLEPVHDERGRAGVAVESLDREVGRRRGADRRRRLRLWWEDARCWARARGAGREPA